MGRFTDTVKTKGERVSEKWESRRLFCAYYVKFKVSVDILVKVEKLDVWVWNSEEELPGCKIRGLIEQVMQ